MSDEVAVEVETKGKKAKADTNLIVSVAKEVENLTKTKALNLADSLAASIETDYFKLGGVLKLIYESAWFEGYATFEGYVYEKFGFKGRKADYLIKIYTALVDKSIPWEKVSHLGWTKLKDLAEVLTVDNVDEWVAKATPVSVVELQAMLKAQLPAGEGGTTSTTSDVEVLKFKLKADQIETVKTALAKVKGEIGTDYDSVALETLCAGHLAGVGGTVAPQKTLSQMFKEVGYEKVLEVFGDVFPEIDIDVKVPE